MRYEKVVAGRFVDRPNRFIAHVELDGRLETVHVKNTGRCRELLVPGARVYLADSWGAEGRPKGRKTRYDLIAVEKGKRLINMDSQAPNAAVKEFLAGGALYPSGTEVRPEYTYGDSRFDFALFTPALALLEVKGVTLEKEGVVLFPDAPTQRGTKHIRELTQFPGDSALLFVVQMCDVSYFCPNGVTDPAFAAALVQAQAAGVRLLAYDCLVTPDSMTIHKEVPIVLGG